MSKSNWLEVLRVMKALSRLSHSYVQTSSWSVLYSLFQCTFELQIELFLAYFQPMQPLINMKPLFYTKLQWITSKKLWKKNTSRCCWHSVQSGWNTFSGWAGACTTNVDWTIKQRVQLIKLFRWRNWSASSKPCWHMSLTASTFGGNIMRTNRFIFCRDNSMLVFAKFICCGR